MKAVQSGGCEAAVSHTDEAKLSELRSLWNSSERRMYTPLRSSPLPSACD
ncbi:hypothetical protein [Ruminococcus flavefaciens]|nr:hypothetical protein [Ruminococcus flavefaciens]